MSNPSSGHVRPGRLAVFAALCAIPAMGEIGCTRPVYGPFNQPAEAPPPDAPPPAPETGAQAQAKHRADPLPADAPRREDVDKKTLVAAARTVKENGVNDANKAVLESKAVEVEKMTRETSEAPSAEYTIGPRDELMIAVAPHGNAGLPGTIGVENSTVGTSSRTGHTVVHDDGGIQLLGIGDFKAAGLTIPKLAEALRKEYAKVIRDPEVIIEIQAYKSQIVYLGGQFGKPGPMPLERRTDLLQLISMAGNPAPAANVRGAYVQRKGKDGKYKMLPVDLYALLEEGDITQNIWIHPDDFIYIPDNTRQQVYMLGNVNRPGPLSLHKDGTLNLAQAVAETGGIRSFGVDWDKVRIIRSNSATRGEFIVVNYQKIIDGEAMPFQLKAGDIVYFANSRLGDWNEALNAITPSFQLIGNALTPFVQLQVLKQTFR